MRRKEKELREKSAIEEVIRGAVVCRMALCGNGRPYVVPLCFGYAGGVFYFHGAQEGRKLELLQRNSRVCLELETGVRIKEAASACGWGVCYKSVIAEGVAVMVTAAGEKRRALQVIIRHYTDRQFTLPDSAVEEVAVFRVKAEKMTGKISGWGKTGSPDS